MSKLSELKKELLKEFKKKNKAAREKFAKNQGFASAEVYLKFLGDGEATKPVSKKKDTNIGKVVETKPETYQDKVIAFDTTGSMSAYIGNVKAHIKQLIPELFKNEPNLRLKIVAFGDYCDMVNKNTFGNAYQESALTDNQEDLIYFVEQASNTSGGDSDEFYELVIKKIVEETSWRKDAKKSVLFIADAEPHEVGYTYLNRIVNNQINWKQEAKKAADKGIKFDTLQILPTITWYKELSRITGGVNLPFQTSAKTGDLLEAHSYYSKGDTKSREKLVKLRTASFASGDKEMTATYDTMLKSMD